MGTEYLDKLFETKSIAVIGASDREGSAGYRIFHNLISNDYQGKVYPVNLKHEKIQGIKAYKSVLDIPGEVDMAVVITPAKTVLGIAEECGKKGIHGMLIISAGFKEVGEEGRKLEAKLNEIREKYQIRIIGPNCVGYTIPRLSLNSMFTDTMPDDGNIALFSQSGAVCGSILDWAADSKVGFSSFVSVGSMLDVDFADLIDYFGNDPNTKAVVIYAESVSEGRAFMSAATNVSRKKPVFIIKAGRFAEGAKAAASHTGSLAGSDDVYNAAFKRSGIIRVTDIVDLFGILSILDKQCMPKGPNLCIITNAGGPGVLAADNISEFGGKLAPLSKKSIEELNKVLPAVWSKANPVDIIGDSDENIYDKAMKICVKDDNVDGLLVLLVPQVMADPDRLAKKIADLAKITDKPILTSFIGKASLQSSRKYLMDHGVPTFYSPAEAIDVFVKLSSYDKNLENLYETPEERAGLRMAKNPTIIDEIIATATKEKRTTLYEAESKEILEQYDIQTTKPVACTTAKEAVEAAKKMGYPVVMKILSPQISHKSDVGGVTLNLESDEEVESEFSAMTKRAKKHEPDADITGVTIQKMVNLEDGFEFILGLNKDSVFGSTILFGLGGVYTELFKDTNIGFPPLTQTHAHRLIEPTKAYQLIKGFRGKPAVDRVKLETLLMNFSQMIIDYPQFKEIDINPLIAWKDEFTALDARVILDPEYKKKPHLSIAPYPYQYVKDVKVNGKTITLRPLRSEDEILWEEMFSRYPEDVIKPFFGKAKTLPHDLRTRFVNNDYDREIGITAETVENKKRCLLGVARIVINPEKSSEGEFMFGVVEDWEDTEIGSHLVDQAIAVAQDKKLIDLYGKIDKDNSSAIELLEKKGFQFIDNGEHYLITHELK